jgi:hypothetical protein
MHSQLARRGKLPDAWCRLYFAEAQSNRDDASRRRVTSHQEQPLVRLSLSVIEPQHES